jgi:DNA-binding NarL/FixJ family response regulator
VGNDSIAAKPDAKVLLVCGRTLGGALGVALRRMRSVFAVPTVSAAREAIGSGALFDVWALADPLPDGSAFALLSEFDAHPPALMFFHRLDAAAMNRAVSLGAVPAIWPMDSRHLAGFLKRADAMAANRLAAHTAHAKQAAQLSEREAEVYREVVMGSGAKEIAVQHGVRECTVRTQFAQILRKMNEPSIDSVRAKTLRKILTPPRSSR